MHRAGLAVFTTGLVLAMIGGGAVFGYIPLPGSVVNTVSFTTPKVNCSSAGACSVSFSFTDVNSTVSFLVYMKAVNSVGQSVFLNYITVQSSASTTTNINALSLGTLKPGAYIFSAFAVNKYGTVVSQTASTAFNVAGSYNLVIDPYNPQTGSVSVSPSCTINSATQSTCPYPAGSKVTITYTPSSGYLFGQWCYFTSGSTSSPTSGCTVSGTFGQTNPGWLTSTDNPLVLTLNSNVELVYSISQSSPAINKLYFTVTPTSSITGCSGTQSCTTLGTVSPTGSTTIYQDSANGPTSATFTATPKDANFTFRNWQVNGKNLTQNPVSLDYTYLKSIQSPSAQSEFQLWAYFKQKVFYQLGVGAYAGITTSPAAKNGGTYTYPAGASVTISTTSVADNVCFSGWIVDGSNRGNQSSITITMDGYHSVFAQGYGKPAAGCTPPPPGQGDYAAWGLITGGAALMAVGAVIGRREVMP